MARRFRPFPKPVKYTLIAAATIVAVWLVWILYQKSHNLTEFIETVGYIGIFIIIFAESGLLIGFFLPGDSLLFTAGLLASQDVFTIWLLLPLTFLAATLGDSVGYAFGRRVGPRLFAREESLLFRKENIDKAKEFYEKHGAKTLVLARFTPIVRTFAPILAGVGHMEYRRFVSFNIIGAFLWAIGVTSAGFYLGNTIPDIDKYLLPIIAGIILLSVLPAVIEIMKDEHRRQQVFETIHRLIKRVYEPFLRRFGK